MFSTFCRLNHNRNILGELGEVKYNFHSFTVCPIYVLSKELCGDRPFYCRLGKHFKLFHLVDHGSYNTS
jgi:hypothetical protein